MVADAVPDIDHRIAVAADTVTRESLQVTRHVGGTGTLGVSWHVAPGSAFAAGVRIMRATAIRAASILPIFVTPRTRISLQ